MTPDIVARFEDCSLPPGEFHHELHVYVVWSYLREMPLALAADRFIRNLKRFAAAHGKATLYHETITWAYVLLVNERMREGDDWDAFRSRNPELFSWKPSVLDRYYRRETLESPLARSTFLLPDIGIYEELR